MKFRIAFAAWLFSGAAFADSLPVITSSPTNTAATPGSTATLSVAATGAASYQWRFNGAEIADATNATLQVPNVQTNNSGYYLAIAKNVIGWVPSQMAWLSVVGSNGIVPFSNIANTNCYDAFGLFLGQAVSQITYQPINGSAQVMAGPALDQMAMVNGSFNRVKVTNGWFNPTVQVVDGLNFYTTNKTVLLPTVVPGQTVYYSVYITYTNNSIVCTQQSRVISMIAGGNGTPIPSMTNLMFPAWLEWPQDPWGGSSQTNQTCVAGETFTLSELWEGGDDCGQPTFQWRKDGVPLGTSQAFPHDYGVSSSCNAQLTISNAQPVDAGIYSN